MKHILILSLFSIFLFGCKKENSSSLNNNNNNPDPLAKSNYRAVMSGDAEVPTHSSNAQGLFEATYNPTGTTLSYTLTYSAVPGTIFTPTVAHIHKGAPGVDGNSTIIFDLGSVTASPMTGNLTLNAEQLNILKSSGYYVHIHSAVFPEGDIRGQIRPKL